MATLTGAAFVDMRSTNYSGAHLVDVDGLSDHDRIGLLTNMFHNVPGQMNRAARGGLRYQTILDDLWEENRGRSGAHDWLDGAVKSFGYDRTAEIFASWLRVGPHDR